MCRTLEIPALWHGHPYSFRLHIWATVYLQGLEHRAPDDVLETGENEVRI